MIATENFFIYLAVCAGVTYLVRAVPLLLVKKKITNRFALSFLHYIPYAVLSVMTVPACFFAVNSPLTAAVGFAIAVALAYLRHSLIVVALGSSGGILLAELIISNLL